MARTNPGAGAIRLVLVAALMVATVLVGALRAPAAARGLAPGVAQGADCATDAAGGGASPAAASPAAAASPPAGGDAAAAPNIAFLPKDVENAYFVTAAGGAEAAAAEIGGEFQQVGPAAASAAEQVTYIQTLTQQGVDAIVVSANDPNALAPSLREAMAQGISVVSYDSDVAPDARMVFVNQADSEEIGRSQVRIMGRLLGCEGEIAVLSAASTATNQNAWIGFMEDELSKPGYENLELVTIEYGDDDPQRSYDKTIELLTAYPDLRGIIAPTTIGIAAAAQALEAEGRGGDVQLTGLGLPNDLRTYVESGTIREFALWNPVDLGYLAYYAAAALVQGTITGAAGETFEAGRLGSYTIGEGGEVVLGPPFVFTAENIGEFDF
jgi:rhamnose transport system substrate-binding protein